MWLTSSSLTSSHSRSHSLRYSSQGERRLWERDWQVSGGLRSRVVYKFSCACRDVCYIGETIRYFSTRVNEHLSSDKFSNTYKHLESSPLCRKSCSKDYLKIIDSTPTRLTTKNLKQKSLLRKINLVWPNFYKTNSHLRNVYTAVQIQAQESCCQRCPELSNTITKISRLLEQIL